MNRLLIAFAAASALAIGCGQGTQASQAQGAQMPNGVTNAQPQGGANNGNDGASPPSGSTSGNTGGANGGQSTGGNNLGNTNSGGR